MPFPGNCSINPREPEPSPAAARPPPRSRPTTSFTIRGGGQRGRPDAPGLRPAFDHLHAAHRTLRSYRRAPGHRRTSISQKASVAGNYLVIVGPSSSIGQTGSFTVAYQRPNNPWLADFPHLRPDHLAASHPARAIGHLHLRRHGRQRRGYPPHAAVRQLHPLCRVVYNSLGTLLGTSASGELQSTLAATGTYALLVRDLNANLGSYRVSLQNDTNARPRRIPSHP